MRGDSRASIVNARRLMSWWCASGADNLSQWRQKLDKHGLRTAF